MTVILVDPRRPAVVPIDAVELLGGDVQYTEEMPIRVQWSLPSARSALMGPAAPVLLSSNPEHPEVKSRVAAGERVIAVPAGRSGERLADAVEIMDRLRTSGPWESEQTHDSLRRYLLEETYELFDAVHGGNALELRDELGDVLLQVLFHARIAEEAPFNAFGIDDVADALIRKLGNRVPAVLAGEHITLEDQLAQWEQRKATEQNSGHDRRSCVDGVPTAQPALALAQKVIDRATAAGVPADLIPSGVTSVSLQSGGDAENDLRTRTLEFLAAVRAAEQSVARARGHAADELDTHRRVGPISAPEWREHWPGAVRQETADMTRAVVHWPDDDSGS
jgi:XTP/dITP diphosphohydrolase